MNTKVIKYLKDLSVSKTSKILLAVSGGIDSMVLMDMLYRHGYNISIAHCNFCLRGKESDEDKLFVEKISFKYKKQFYSKEFTTKEYSIQNKISFQMAARVLRYEWFDLLKEKYDFDFICTAHHHDDSVETFLINLIRGTGISGLHGIKGIVCSLIRPMSMCSKKDIIDYANKYGIIYREDSSNKDDKYVRNKIRNKIIPLMQEINPRVLDAIGNTISRVSDVESIYQKLVSEKKKNYCKNHMMNLQLISLHF